MSAYFDAQETQTVASRERALFDEFSARLLSATERCPGLGAHLQGCELSSVRSRSSLASLPVLRKNTLIEAQQALPPFGGFVDEQALSGSRVFMSPGPVWEPQVCGVDPWRAARALFAAGIRAGDRVHNAFSYQLTPGGFILDEGARALGCVVFPAGVGNSDAQIEALQHLGSSAYVGTPDYLQKLLNRASELGVKLPRLTRALVSGGALFPEMRERYRDAGIHVQQCYATADLGVISYESGSDDTIHAGMVVNEDIIVEIVRPGTGDGVLAGEVGEIVVTRLCHDYPLVRFATGDLSAFIEEPSPCGRTNLRIAGWLGRADQRTKIKGMFIDPAQIQKIRQSHAEINNLRLLVTRMNDQDVMMLQIEPASTDTTIDTQLIADTLKSITGLSGNVSVVNLPLPNDGVVIDDQRDYTQS